MTPKDALEWLKLHKGKEIRLSDSGSALSLTGLVGPVEELDACATHFYECQLDTGVEGVELWITLQDSALVVHLTVKNQAGGAPPSICFPATLDYSRLRLQMVVSTPDVSVKEEEPYSPYELLHQTRSSS